MKTIILIFLLPLSVFAGSSVQSQLDQFKKNQSEFMNQLPLKETTLKPKKSFLSLKDTRLFLKEDRRSIENKVKFRNKYIIDDSVPLPNDRPEELIENGTVLKNIFDMDKRNLSTGKIPVQPWSGDYWPLAEGSIGARYEETQFLRFSIWKSLYDYVLRNPMSDVLNSAVEEDIDSLSPAEKYDRLFNDQPKLTTKMWLEGKRYYDSYNEVESWMGICHGWAAAAYTVPRPVKKVSVKAYDGKIINFYPDDIKALVSLLWAKAPTRSLFVGGRCNTKKPEVDEDGRLIEADCIDNNPMTWHTVVVNRLGKNKKSFVMDATYDYEVWNQPVVSYEYEYFNPKTLRKAQSLKEALVNYQDFPEDRFSKHRAPNIKSVVGIGMKVVYSTETNARHTEFDSPSDDSLKTVHYIYDLELDRKGNILGGEWYQNAHPDFLWTPPEYAKAYSPGDQALQGDEYWDGKSPLNEQWKSAAEYSSYFGMPLEKVVQSLLNLSIQR